MSPLVVALLAAHNEADIIGSVIRDLIAQGVSVYVIDDGSTDETVAVAEPYVGRGVIHIERFTRPGDPAAIVAEMDRITAAREASQPIREKTGGSTFKNPPGRFAANPAVPSRFFPPHS